MPEACYVPGTVWGTGRELPEGTLVLVQAYLILVHFTVLYRCCVFYKVKVYGNPALSKFISTIFPIACTHFLSLCHSLVTLTLSQTFSLFLYLLWWPVISDLWCYYSSSRFGMPRTVSKWVNEIHRWVNTVYVLTLPPTDCALSLFPSPWASLFPETQNCWN